MTATARNPYQRRPGFGLRVTRAKMALRRLGADCLAPIYKERIVRLPVQDGRGGPIVVPESAAEQRRGGGLVLETHSRLFSYMTPDGKTEPVRRGAHQS